jgi:RimJ/RimL family protein N-acetyltransferase
MHLKPVEDQHVAAVARWLGDPERAKWLSFGPGVEALSQVGLKVMIRREQHILRQFAAGEGDPPAGVVALSDIDRRFRTAMLWYVLGEDEHRGRGYTSRAVSRLLTMGFSALGLEAVNAWVVDGNSASIRVLERNGFQYVGRQRRCHVLDGAPRDRLLFDLVASEHKERA